MFFEEYHFQTIKQCYLSVTFIYFIFLRSIVGTFIEEWIMDFTFSELQFIYLCMLTRINNFQIKL